MTRSNALSAFGRMSWGTHFLIYPISFGVYIGVYGPYKTKADQTAK